MSVGEKWRIISAGFVAGKSARKLSVMRGGLPFSILLETTFLALALSIKIFSNLSATPLWPEAFIVVATNLVTSCNNCVIIFCVKLVRAQNKEKKMRFLQNG